MAVFVAEAIAVGRWISPGESRCLQDNSSHHTRSDYHNGFEERTPSTTVHSEIRNYHADQQRPSKPAGNGGSWAKSSGLSMLREQQTISIFQNFGKKFGLGYGCRCHAAFSEGRRVPVEISDSMGLLRRWRQRTVSIGSYEDRMSSASFALANDVDEREVGSDGGDDWSGEQVAAAIAVALHGESNGHQITVNRDVDGVGSEDRRWIAEEVAESCVSAMADDQCEDVDDGGYRAGAGGLAEDNADSDVRDRSDTDVGTDADSDGGGPTSPESVLMSSSSQRWSGEALSPVVKELVYQVLEVVHTGEVFKKHVTRRQLLKSSGLRPRDLRRIDPSLWVTNALPALLVRDHAILINLGSLRAIVTPENVLVFDESSVGAHGFLDVLLQRLQAANSNGSFGMPFELEVLESALISREQRLENALNQVEPRVRSLLAVLPNKVAPDALEELRISKQALVELGSKAGALRQMLLEILETPNDIRRISAMGHHCDFRHGVLVCDTGKERDEVEEEEEEVEMLLEYYLQRVDLCHGQSEKLLESAKEMEDSIAVNLSSRRLEVSRFELMLAIATFAAAIGAMIAGIFGMNLRSYLEEHVSAFWVTAGGIVIGCIVLFFALLAYLRRRKIL